MILPWILAFSLGVSWGSVALVEHLQKNALHIYTAELHVPVLLAKSKRLWHDYFCRKPDGQDCREIKITPMTEARLDELIPADYRPHIQGVVQELLAVNGDFSEVNPWQEANFECCAREPWDNVGVVIARSDDMIMTVEPSAIKSKYMSRPQIAISNARHCLAPPRLPLGIQTYTRARQFSAWPGHWHTWVESWHAHPSCVTTAANQVVIWNDLIPTFKGKTGYRILNAVMNAAVAATVMVWSDADIEAIRAEIVRPDQMKLTDYLGELQLVKGRIESLESENDMLNNAVKNVVAHDPFLTSTTARQISDEVSNIKAQLASFVSRDELKDHSSPLSHILRGPKGDKGDKGDRGDPGAPGTAVQPEDAERPAQQTPPTIQELNDRLEAMVYAINQAPDDLHNRLQLALLPQQQLQDMIGRSLPTITSGLLAHAVTQSPPEETRDLLRALRQPALESDITECKTVVANLGKFVDVTIGDGSRRSIPINIAHVVNYLQKECDQLRGQVFDVDEKASSSSSESLTRRFSALQQRINGFQVLETNLGTAERKITDLDASIKALKALPPARHGADGKSFVFENDGVQLVKMLINDPTFQNFFITNERFLKAMVDAFDPVAIKHVDRLKAKVNKALADKVSEWESNKFLTTQTVDPLIKSALKKEREDSLRWDSEAGRLDHPRHATCMNQVMGRLWDYHFRGDTLRRFYSVVNLKPGSLSFKLIEGSTVSTFSVSEILEGKYVSLWLPGRDKGLASIRNFKDSKVSIRIGLADDGSFLPRHSHNHITLDEIKSYDGYYQGKITVEQLLTDPQYSEVCFF